MGKKNKNPEIEQTEQTEQTEIKKAGRQAKDENISHNEYVERMNCRIKKGEKKSDGNELTVMTFDEWKEKGKPTGETPTERAVRLGTKRLNHAVQAIRLLSNLSGSGYKLSDENINVITTTLQNEVDKVKNDLNKVKVKANEIILK